SGALIGEVAPFTIARTFASYAARPEAERVLMPPWAREGPLAAVVVVEAVVGRPRLAVRPPAVPDIAQLTISSTDRRLLLASSATVISPTSVSSALWPGM